MLLVVPLVVFALVPSADPVDAQVRAEAERLVEERICEAIVLAACAGGEESFAGFGRIGPDRPDRPDQTTLFEIGSITKVYTGLLLAVAVEEGAVSLDDPVDRFLPAGVRWPEDEGGVLLAHLATHTSGLPRLPRSMRPSDPLDPYADFELDDLWSEVAESVLDAPPGERYAYSNLGYGLLGALLARALGAPDYPTALRDRVLIPLGLRDTYFEVPPSCRERFAAPAKAGLVRARRWRFSALAAAGALRQSARDLLAFARAQLAPDETALAEAIRRSHTILHRLPDGGGVAYGWHVRSDGVLWHNGQTGGYHAVVAVDRASGVAVCALASAVPARGGRIDAVVFSWLERLRAAARG